MKKKQKQEVRAKSLSELEAEIVKRQAEIQQVGIQIMTAKTKNTSLLRTKKDELAVVKTILKENSQAIKPELKEEQK